MFRFGHHKAWQRCLWSRTLRFSQGLKATTLQTCSAEILQCCNIDATNVTALMLQRYSIDATMLQHWCYNVTAKLKIIKRNPLHTLCQMLQCYSIATAQTCNTVFSPLTHLLHNCNSNTLRHRSSITKIQVYVNQDDRVKNSFKLLKSLIQLNLL